MIDIAKLIRHLGHYGKNDSTGRDIVCTPFDGHYGHAGNGSAALVIDHVCKMAMRDIDDRGDDKKPRKIIVTITLEKRDNGEIDAVVEANCTLPRMRTPPTVCKLKRQGDGAVALFQEYNAENPDQNTLPNVYDGQGEE